MLFPAGCLKTVTFPRFATAARPAGAGAAGATEVLDADPVEADWGGLEVWSDEEPCWVQPVIANPAMVNATTVRAYP
jgi:hypothetical protein